MRATMRLVVSMTVLIIILVGGTATVVGESPVVNPDNGHYYALVASTEISWSDAYVQANETDLGNCLGYLATVTSAQENQFLVDNFGEVIGTSGYGFWLGGYQDPGVGPADEGWQWVTGESWAYTNWAPNEPNDADGYASEQYLDIQGFESVGVGVWNDENYLLNIRGYIVECEPWQHIVIDIKPGSHSNPINLKSKGVVVVAVLSTGDFDASTINPDTVRFADAIPVAWALKPVDRDRDLDLRFSFKTQELNLNAESTRATLTGRTFAGNLVRGTDNVKIVP